MQGLFSSNYIYVISHQTSGLSFTYLFEFIYLTTDHCFSYVEYHG